MLKTHKIKLVSVWKYMCIGDRTLNGRAVYESAGLDTHKITHSHVLCVAGTEMVTAHYRSCKGCVIAHEIFGDCGHDVSCLIYCRCQNIYCRV
jgi:hypothetical protein